MFFGQTKQRLKRGDIPESEAQIAPLNGQSDERFLVPTRQAQKIKQSKPRIPFFALQYIFSGGDALIILLVGLLAGGGYQFLAFGEFSNIEQHVGASAIAALLFILLATSTGFYDVKVLLTPLRREALKILSHWALVALVLSLLAFLMKSGAAFSRGSTVSVAILTPIVLIMVRQRLKSLLSKALVNGFVGGRLAIIIGTQEELCCLRPGDLLERFGCAEFRRIPLGSISDPVVDFSVLDRPALDSALALSRSTNVDIIFLALSWENSRRIELLRDLLRVSPVAVQLLPDHRIRTLIENPSFRLTSAFSIEVQRSPLNNLERFIKRIIDIIGALVGIITLMPVMSAAAIAIKLENSGKILFHQRRKGFNQREFSILKFRTMIVTEDGSVITQATRNDPRITNVGRFLRRSSIDELPQLFNVLRGEMSLVGPRPHAIAHDDAYSKLLSEYAFRHHMKPGITGWAQVKGLRGETSTVEQMKLRVEHDIWYINNWSFLLDLRIVWTTFFEVARSDHAY